MTKVQLEEIFDQMDRGEYAPSSQEIIMLVDEIQSLQEKFDAIDELVCTTIIGCGKCSTCQTISGLEKEVERLTAERDAFMTLDASYRQQINEAMLRTNQAYKRGAEAMRDVVADFLEEHEQEPTRYREGVLRLPIPEDK